MDDILVIRMQSNTAECSLCGRETDYKWGIPVFNGDVVSNDFPDWMWSQGGGGQAVCRSCYEKHERGEIPTFDHYYVPATLMGDPLMDGGGI